MKPREKSYHEQVRKFSAVGAGKWVVVVCGRVVRGSDAESSQVGRP